MSTCSILEHMGFFVSPNFSRYFLWYYRENREKWWGFGKGIGKIMIPYLDENIDKEIVRNLLIFDRKAYLWIVISWRKERKCVFLR